MHPFFFQDLPERLVAHTSHHADLEDVFQQLGHRPACERAAQQFRWRQGDLDNIGPDFWDKLHGPTAASSLPKQRNTFTIKASNQLTDVFLVQAGHLRDLLYRIAVSRVHDDLSPTPWRAALPVTQNPLNVITFSPATAGSKNEQTSSSRSPFIGDSSNILNVCKKYKIIFLERH